MPLFSSFGLRTTLHGSASLFLPDPTLFFADPTLPDPTISFTDPNIHLQFRYLDPQISSLPGLNNFLDLTLCSADPTIPDPTLFSADPTISFLRIQIFTM